MNNYYANLWSANNTDYDFYENEVVKTIYDPSPAGYKTSAKQSLYGFYYNGRSSTLFVAVQCKRCLELRGMELLLRLEQDRRHCLFPCFGLSVLRYRRAERHKNLGTLLDGSYRKGYTVGGNSFQVVLHKYTGRLYSKLWRLGKTVPE